MVPLVAHFVWIGQGLPYTHVLALRSAARRGGFSRVIFHHTHDLSASKYWADISKEPGVECARLNPDELVKNVHPEFDLLQRFHRLEQPAAIVNVLRALILYGEGGVYLDLDTITLKSFEDICESSSFFCGEEHLVFPASVRASFAPWVQGLALVRTLIRDVLRRVPKGFRAFSAIERFFPRAANNAVLGACAGHPFLRHLLKEMQSLPEREWTRRYRLGTHLLQRGLASYQGRDATVLGPEFFYPLGPEVSEHWFRVQSPPMRMDMLTEKTLLVHWYASVRTEPYTRELDADAIVERAGVQPFAALALPFVQ